ncbi:hypothetical protein Cgig2_013669 [Carnegiea gigantea]|uniref:Uncharacterized protein n=1 Tax=Carnegiea gigantea TaxID=171969 RepID=A0A9Q1K1E6_9CARY|nr:hypothetical protein Cgig2_013669 [Carnegiea gigantea]
MNGYSVYYAFIVLHCMYRVANMGRTSSLSYGNLLTRIFNHFKVPLDLEDFVAQPVSIISANSLKILCFYKTAARGWKHISELTHKELTALKIPLFESPSLATLAESLQSLKEDHTELRTRVVHIQSEMGIIGRKMDELIRLTSLVHHGVKFVVSFKPIDLDSASNVADHIIQMSNPASVYLRIFHGGSFERVSHLLYAELEVSDMYMDPNYMSVDDIKERVVNLGYSE